MIVFVLTQQIIAQNCTQDAPYLLNAKCVQQCSTTISIIDESGICLPQCFGQTDSTAVDDNGKKYKICKPCQADKPFFYIPSSQCVAQCPTTSLANTSLVCLQSCDGGHIRNELLNTSAGQFDYRLCFKCTPAFPFYNSTTQNCTFDCNKNKDIYVTQENVCTTVELCPVKVPSSQNNIQFTRCNNCSQQEPFIENGKCTNKCSINTNNLVNEYNVCLQVCQGTTSEKIIQEQTATLCEKCPITSPFWNGASCVSQCEQKFNGLSTVSEDNVCQQYTAGYLNKIDIFGQQYYEITTFCTTNLTTENGQVCLSCAEIDPAKPFLNGLICDNKCSIQINGQNLVTYQKRCISYAQTSIDTFISRFMITDFTTQYFIKVPKCPSNEVQLSNGLMVCRPCTFSNTIEDNGACRKPTENDIVDINNILLNSCPSNYNQLQLNNYKYCLPPCTYYAANSLGCLQKCDIQNILYYGNNLAYCLQSTTQVNSLRVQSTNNTSQYFKYEENNGIAECPSGYKRVVNNCIKVDSCIQFSQFCNSAICQSYSYDTNNVCENRCLGASIYNDNRICTACPTDQVVENNVCVAQCSSQSLLLEDKKCVSECTILTINNLSVRDSVNSSICLTQCSTYMFQNQQQPYYTCQSNCSSTNKPFYQVYNYQYNQFTKDANVCVAECASNQGTYLRGTETQCMICHQNQLVNQNGVCLTKCLQNGETIYYDVDGYCQLNCNGYVFNGEKCYSSCKQNNLVVTSNKLNCSTQCIQDQSISTAEIQNENVCVDSCPQFSQDGYCVNACNSSYPFIFNNNVCTANCNGSAVIVVNQKRQCLSQCNQITVPKHLDYINYYICTPSCYTLNMVDFNQSCHENCYIAQQTQTTEQKPSLFKYNGQCLSSCPSDNFYTDQQSQENICTGLTQSQKMGIGIGIAVAVVIIIIILVPTILVILKKKNIIKFKYPLPKCKEQATFKGQKNPINLLAVQQSLENDALVNSLQKVGEDEKQSEIHTYT